MQVQREEFHNICFLRKRKLKIIKKMKRMNATENKGVTRNIAASTPTSE